MSASLGRPLIVLVDDFNDSRDMYAEYLALQGYRVVSAGSGAEALTIAHLSERPGLILLDLRMLDANGAAAVQLLRSAPAFAGVPIVAFTGYALHDEAESSLRAVFDGVIAKPCLPDQLLVQIQPFLPANGGRPDAEV